MKTGMEEKERSGGRDGLGEEGGAKRRCVGRGGWGQEMDRGSADGQGEERKK
jgi:hypothetical protein